MAIPERQVEILVGDTVGYVIDEAIGASDGPMIKFGGVDLDERRRNYMLFRQEMVMALMKALKTSGAITVRPEDPRERSIIRDPRLRDSLKEGFDEGRPSEPQKGTQKVGEAELTNPEHYEQLQLPGFEDADDDDA